MIRTLTLSYNWWNAETRKLPPKKHQKTLEEFTENTVFPLIQKGHWGGDLEFRIHSSEKHPEGILYRACWGVQRDNS